MSMSMSNVKKKMNEVSVILLGGLVVAVMIDFREINLFNECVT